MKLGELIIKIKGDKNLSPFSILKILSKLEDRDLTFYLSKKDINDIIVEEDVIKKAKKYFLEDYPLEYLTNKAVFLGNEFCVNEDVLIPRIETEDLVLLALNLIKEYNIKTVADIGTGSGAIAISIKKSLPHVNVWATDISSQALKVAKLNASKLDVSIEFSLGSYLDSILDNIDKIELIISNPPYVETNFIEKASSLKYEPRIALDGGQDGQNFFRELIRYSDILKDKVMIFETTEFNIEKTAFILSKIGKTYKLPDSFGKERFILVFPPH
jgi:release factor glutamine methyltransferase